MHVAFRSRQIVSAEDSVKFGLVMKRPGAGSGPTSSTSPGHIPRPRGRPPGSSKARQMMMKLVADATASGQPTPSNDEIQSMICNLTQQKKLEKFQNTTSKVLQCLLVPLCLPAYMSLR